MPARTDGTATESSTYDAVRESLQIAVSWAAQALMQLQLAEDQRGNGDVTKRQRINEKLDYLIGERNSGSRKFDSLLRK